jgi:hypothetical protein
VVRVQAADRRWPALRRHRPDHLLHEDLADHRLHRALEQHRPGRLPYLDTDPGACEVTTALDGQWFSKTGNSVPSACSTSDFSEWLNRTVLLPLFEEAGETGNNAWYRVYGYAAFRLTGYHLGGQYSTNTRPCGGNDRCVAGYFTRFVELSDAWNYSPDAPQLGSSILRLIR